MTTNGPGQCVCYACGGPRTATQVTPGEWHYARCACGEIGVRDAVEHKAPARDETTKKRGKR